VRDRTIEVTVPAGATTGPVRVIHPAGEAISPVVTIDDGSPVIYDFNITLIEAGDTLTILGRNLAGVTAVELGGGAMGTNLSSTDAQITVTVPNGVGPGPVTVTVAAGQTTSQQELAVLEISAGSLMGNFSFGLGLSVDEQTLYAVQANPAELVIADVSNGAFTELPRVPIGGVTTSPTMFALSPDGTRGLIYEQQARVHVIAIPAGTLVGTCPRSPPLGSNADYFPPRFDDTARYAFARKPTDAPGTEEGYLRIDLADGTCEYFVTNTALMGLGVQGLLFDPVSSELLVAHGTRGHGYFDVQTGLPTTPTMPPAFSHPQLFRGLAGPSRIYGLNLAGLVAVDLFSGRDPDVITTDGGLGAQTRNARWLFVGDVSNEGYFVDLLEERIARSVTGVRGEHLAAGISSFFIDTDVGVNESIRRYSIRD
jgi:hypothetical protein